LRVLLASLRALVLVLLVVILCRPVLSLALPGGAARGILVLLDRSRSMELPGRGEDTSRDAELRRALAAARAELSGYPLSYRGFAAGVGPLVEPDDLAPPEGDATDLARALEEGMSEGTKGGRPGALLLLSDGAQTEGPDPVEAARRLGVPVETIALGSSNPVPDLSLVRIRANREAFAGEQTPLEAVVRLQGLNPTSIGVQLFDVTRDTVELASEAVRLDADGAEQRVSLRFTPTQTGLRFLEVRLPVLEGEASSANNRRLVALDVREEKTGVLFLSGALTWDHTFLSRALESDSTLSVTNGLWRNGSFQALPPARGLPSLTAGGLGDIDVIVLDHIVPSELSADLQRTLLGFVEGGGGLLLVSGGETGPSAWAGRPLERVLPVLPGNRGGSEELQVHLTPAARRHALFDPTVPGAVGVEAWGDLPPVWVPFALGSARGNAEVLLAGPAPQEAPVLSWARLGRGRVILLAAGGVWKWGFNSVTHAPGGAAVPGWWRRTVHWLARPAQETRLDIHPEEYVVPRGNPVTFVARVTDEAYQPLPDVDVSVDLLPEGAPDRESIQVHLGGAEGFYQGTVRDLPPARYRYQGTARHGADALGTVEGTLVVDSLGTEVERLEADHEVLERISAASGGSLWEPDSLEGLGQAFQIHAQAEEERVQVALWDNPLLFVILVLAASAEWYLRRRQGLI